MVVPAGWCASPTGGEGVRSEIAEPELIVGLDE